MDKYKNYIFDLYGTLVDIHTNERKPYLWQKMADFYSSYGAVFTAAEIKKEYFNLCHKEERKLSSPYGEIKLELVFHSLFEKSNREISSDMVFAAAQMFRVISRDTLGLYEGVIPFLEYLKAHNKRIYLLSNAQEIFTLPEMDALKISSYFDGIYISSVVGVKKPGTEFMEELFVKEGLKKEESIMIGNDQSTDIQIAKDYGIDSLYIHSNLSPEYEKGKEATYEILDGNVNRVIELMVKK